MADALSFSSSDSPPPEKARKRVGRTPLKAGMAVDKGFMVLMRVNERENLDAVLSVFVTALETDPQMREMLCRYFKIDASDSVAIRKAIYTAGTKSQMLRFAFRAFCENYLDFDWVTAKPIPR